MRQGAGKPGLWGSRPAVRRPRPTPGDVDVGIVADSPATRRRCRSARAVIRARPGTRPARRRPVLQAAGTTAGSR